MDESEEETCKSKQIQIAKREHSVTRGWKENTLLVPLQTPSFEDFWRRRAMKTFEDFIIPALLDWLKIWKIRIDKLINKCQIWTLGYI